MTSFAFGGQTQTPAFGGFSFGASTSTTSTPSFSSSPFASAATNVSGSGTGFGFGTTPATTTPSLFGTSTAFQSTPSTLFPSLGQTATTSAPSTGFSFGSGFGAATTSSTGLNFGGQAAGISAVTSTPATIGLGGVDLQASSINDVDSSKKKDKAVKETFIPPELVATFTSFKKFMEQQKEIREQMSRVSSSKNILRAQSQVTTLRQQLSGVSNGLQRNAIAVTKLKQESSEELRNAEIIQRTKDTLPALQYENTAPSLYFHNLAIGFENQMQSYRQQIEQLERHLLSLSQSSTMTPSELTIVMQHLHDAFVTLASQLHTVHQQIQHHKEQFLAHQKAHQTDVTDIFQSQIQKTATSVGGFPLTRPKGPIPLASASSSVSSAIGDGQSRIQLLQGSSTNLGTNTSGFGSGLNSSSFLGNTQSLVSSFGTQSASNFKPLGK